MDISDNTAVAEDHTDTPDRASTGTLCFTAIEDALAAAGPVGSRVRFIGFDDVSRFLRLGYRAVESDADIVIARGGERELDRARKAVAPCRDGIRARVAPMPDDEFDLRNGDCAPTEETLGAKLIFVPTRDHAAACADVGRTLDENFAVLRPCAAPFAAVFDGDETDGALASVFGGIVALDLCAFDEAFGARMRGDAPDDVAAKRIAELVAELTTRLLPVAKLKARAAALLADAGKRAAEIVADCPRLLHGSGASQTAEALRMLCIAEDRPTGLSGETEMLVGETMIDFYMKNLVGSRLEFPPDNNRRIDGVCEYFKADVRRACVYQTPILPPTKMRLCEYRRDEFRAEQMRMLAGVKRRYLSAFRVFKRLYPDDGYSLSTMIDKTDLSICLALAPDVFAGDTLLSFLKQTGKLDKYLI